MARDQWPTISGQGSVASGQWLAAAPIRGRRLLLAGQRKRALVASGQWSV